jgi:hypothetical protein
MVCPEFYGSRVFLVVDFFNEKTRGLSLNYKKRSSVKNITHLHTHDPTQ